jgi:hypothetical protein
MPDDDTGRRRRTDPQADEGTALLLAEVFGRDGDGGRFAALEATVRTHGVKISELEMLKWKLMGMVTLGGVLAGLVAWSIGYLGK